MCNTTTQTKFVLSVWILIANSSLICTDWVEIPQIATKMYKHATHDFVTLGSTATTTPKTDADKNGANVSSLNGFSHDAIEDTTQTGTTETTTESNPSDENDYNEPKEGVVETNPSDEKDDDEQVPEDLNSYPNSSFLPFFNLVESPLLKNAPKKVIGKIRVLRKLKSNLLLEIQDRIQNLFSDSGAQARHYKEEEHHMEFPSNEGALMTIGFLTFAVFLIKLVLKLIEALKYKENYYNMSMMGNMDTMMQSYIGRKRRSITDEQMRILSFVDELRIS